MINSTLCFVVVSYNSEKYIEKCIESIFSLNIEISFRVVVVDNCSTDLTREILRKYDPDQRVSVVNNEKNFGFGVANNIGISMCSSKYYFLLNVDAYFDQSFDINAVLEVFSKQNQLAIIGPRLIYPDGAPQTSSFSRSSPFKWIVQSVPLYAYIKKMILKSKFLLDFLSKYSKVVSSYVHNHSLIYNDYCVYGVDWVSGAALVIRGEYVKLHGMFDENIFLYGEDEDLCLTARENGWDVCVQNTDPIVHVHGWNSTSRFNAVVAKMKYNSLNYFIDKWFSGISRLLMKILLPIYVYGWRRLLFR